MSDLDGTMAADSQFLRPSEAADQLGVSGATLRRWSNRFSAFLDLADQGGESGSHRRYSAGDLAVLGRVKDWLEQGWTYEQVNAALLAGDGVESTIQTPSQEPDEAVAEEDVLSSEMDAPLSADAPTSSGVLAPVEALNPAAQFVRETLQGMADTQKIILHSQQASRDLMGVMIQDNLNLKSDSASLRERILELERELSEQRRRQADYRERMETRVRVLEDAVARLMTREVAPPPPATPYPYQPPAAPAAPAPTETPRRSFWSKLLSG